MYYYCIWLWAFHRRRTIKLKPIPIAESLSSIFINFIIIQFFAFDAWNMEIYDPNA